VGGTLAKRLDGTGCNTKCCAPLAIDGRSGGRRQRPQIDANRSAALREDGARTNYIGQKFSISFFNKPGDAWHHSFEARRFS